MDFFFKHPKLPFVECRYSTDSESQYKPHMHKTFCVGAVVHGEVNFQVDGKGAKLQPGRLALINPETLHSCNPPRLCKRSYYMLFLDIAWCTQLQQSLWHLETFRPASTPWLEDKPTYRQCLKAVESLMGDGDLLEKEQFLVELIEMIFIKTCEPAAEKIAPGLHIDQLKQALSTHLDLDLSLSQLALQLQANPYTLLRQFKRSTGLTPHAYRLNCRIELARKLLQKGMDLSQVALECGFCDQSHFHRHFKAITTVTPKAYQVNFIQSF